MVPIPLLQHVQLTIEILDMLIVLAIDTIVSHIQVYTIQETSKYYMIKTTL